MLQRIFAFSIAALLFGGCTEENNYITNAPADWQGPVIEWRYQPDAEIRGTVGIDVNVADSSAVTRVRLYLNGRADQTLASPPYRFELVTDSLPDGVHICEARAWDEHGNLGISPVLRINVVNSIAQGPSLIWVPDDYELIQAAINSAADYDTIRVRNGIYYETLNTFGKGIWLESENGPLSCEINAAGSNSAITVSPSRNLCTFRGLKLTGGQVIVRPENGGQVDLFNCILFSDTAWALWFSTYAACNIWNNMFIGAHNAVSIGYTWGTFYNNIISSALEYGFWDAAIHRNPLAYGYSLFWNNAQNYYEFEPGVGDIYADPLIDLEVGRLREESPAIDAGNPDILDLDGSRSDIGPFGGPWAYSN